MSRAPNCIWKEFGTVDTAPILSASRIHDHLEPVVARVTARDGGTISNRPASTSPRCVRAGSICIFTPGKSSLTRPQVIDTPSRATSTPADHWHIGETLEVNDTAFQRSPAVTASLKTKTARRTAPGTKSE